MSTSFLLFKTFWFFYYHTLHILIKALFLRFLSLQLLHFYFLYFFYTSNITIKLTKLDEVSKCLISSFISLYYFRALFIKTNSSWLITESIKALEINTSILFNFDFVNNTILSCFFFLFLNYWLIFFNSCSYCTNC